MMTEVSWYSIFIICGENMDPDDISERLKMQPSAFVKAGELPVPERGEGVTRTFDDRLKLDTWKKQLSAKQLKQGFKEQIEFWVNILLPVKNEIQELTKAGYWCVIDFQAYKSVENINAVQFRIEPEIQLKLAKISVCIDINVF